MSGGDRELSDRLRELRAPDEEAAEERSWEIVRAAYSERTPVRPAPRARRLALAVAGGAVALAIGLSPAGAKVGDLVSEMVGIGEPDAKPALRSLPSAGEHLVSTPTGLWVVHDDGSKRLLGDYGDGDWSPNGTYVAAADGRELVALEPDGDVRWTLPASAPVRDPRWIGTEIDTRIAYRSGDDLRVVTGDGDPATDHAIAHDVAPVPAAWRPLAESKLVLGAALGPYLLTYVDRDGEVRTVNADSGARVPTTAADRARLAWTAADGRSARALSPDGSRVATVERAGRAAPKPAADPAGLSGLGVRQDRLVITRPDGKRRSVLFSAPGDLGAPTWSPDGRWLLLGWPDANQWLFIHAERPRRVIAFDRISQQFDPGATSRGPSRFPRIEGWALPSS